MILIPTYNEKGNIEELIKRIRAVLPNEKLYFIDDSSPDGTAEEIKRLRKNDPNIFLEIRPEKNGIGSAYLNAIKKQLSSGEENYFITMDADLSHDPKYLPELIAELQENDFVIGSRYIKQGGVSNWNFARVLLSKFGNIYARVLSGSKIKDLTAGFVAYSAKALKKLELSKIESDGYAFQIEMKRILENSGATFKEIPITFAEREKGESKLSWEITLEGFLFPLKIWLKRFLVETILFTLTFALYAVTAPRTIFFGDNAEFITAVRSLGVPHPSGYPLYVLLAKLFSFLHLGNPVLAINLFSSFCAALAIAIFYNLITKVIERRHALISALLLAVSAIFWSQAIIAEVYSLNFLLLTILVSILFRIKSAADRSMLYIFALMLGLSLANHEMMALVTPVLLIPIFLIKGWSKRTLFTALLFIILGLAVYLYLPISSSTHPALDWGHTSGSLREFFRQILRADYKDLGARGNPSSRVDFAASAFLNIFDQFKWLLILLIPGIYFLFKEQRKILAFTAGILTFNILGIILLRSLAFSQESADFQAVYFIPAYAVTAFWIGSGLKEASVWIPQKKIANVATLAIGLIAVLIFFNASLQMNRLTNFTFLQNYSKNYLLSLKPNAVLAMSIEGSSEDSILFSMLYQQKIAHLRPDVEIITYKNILQNTDSSETEKIFSNKNIASQRNTLVVVLKNKFSGRPLYTSYLVPKCIDNGYACEVDSSQQVNDNQTEISQNDIKIMSSDFEGTDVLANYYLHQAAYYLGKDTPKSYDFLIKSIATNNEVEGADMQSFANYRNTK